jgi:hypothetical protein
MILGLILSTLNQLPSPPETSAEPPTILTPIALGTFPSGSYAAARESIIQEKSNLDETAFQVPTLVELMLHYARTMPPPDYPNPTTPEGYHLYKKRLEVESRFEMTSLNDFLQQNTPFYSHVTEESDDPWGLRRNRTPPGPRVMYLSAATLIVVPPNLLSQWHREINKHCERPLRVFILRAGSKIPSARSLANDYDVRLSHYPRIL